LASRKSNPGHVTLSDVARESGFSASTVSIVLNEAPLSRYVAARTKEHIRQTAANLGYRPDAFARSLRKRRSQTIGIMVSDLSDPFCTLILRGIEQTLDTTNYLPVIMDAHNQRQQFEQYLEMLLEHRVEGLIVVANWVFAEFDLLTSLDGNNIPTVGVGRDLTANHIRSVQVNNEAGGYLAAEHLYRLGHRQIAILRGPDELSDSVRRWEGISRFAQTSGLPLEPSRVLKLPWGIDANSAFEGGYQLTNTLLKSGSPFTAVLAFDDFTALGSLRALRETGRRVPEDCSIVGFDDIPLAGFHTPPLTTIKQPMWDMGSLAAKWVLRSLETGHANEITDLELLPPCLVERESTRIIKTCK
jgi:DNA-binding LacI/PurR family transcriptional regulator